MPERKPMTLGRLILETAQGKWNGVLPEPVASEVRADLARIAREVGWGETLRRERALYDQVL